ncbi:MAG: glycosyltransferase, partial [Lutibacter sp.]
MFEYLFYTFCVILSIQTFYYAIFSSFSFFTKNKNNNLKNSFPVSVIVCAKNEAANLLKLIPKLLDQKYATFELVLVNDNSSDETLKVMQQFKTNKIKIVDVKPNEQFWGSKKYALTLGIKAASYNYLLFTDADCFPQSNLWISTMVASYNNSTEIVLGYGKYKKIESSFLNKLIRFETLITAIQYFSYAKIGIPYMGVGRNLSYTKKLFYKNNGFANHIYLKSGDDDLFVSETANQKNCAICIDESSFTISNPKKTFKEWINQKRRHISTAKYYKPLHKFILGSFYFSNLSFYILAILLIISGNFVKATYILIFSKMFIQYLVIGKSA